MFVVQVLSWTWGFDGFLIVSESRQTFMILAAKPVASVGEPALFIHSLNQYFSGSFCFVTVGLSCCNKGKKINLLWMLSGEYQLLS